MGRNNLAGAWGELQAAKYLQKKKYKLIASGYRSRFGEIDLIVADKEYLVFVEVKTRKSAAYAEAKEFVNYHKQNRLRATAQMYLSQYPTSLQPRFDVIEVYAPEGVDTQKPIINHLENAFI